MDDTAVYPARLCLRGIKLLHFLPFLIIFPYQPKGCKEHECARFCVRVSLTLQGGSRPAPLSLCP
jgi:hypothetical protein